MQFIRYLLVQVIAYSIDMGGFIFLTTYFEMPLLVANTISKIFAGIFAFLSHSKFTFNVSKEKFKGRQFFRYFLLLAINIPISALILSFVLMVAHSVVVGKFISDVIGIFFTFWLSKRFVFFKSESNVNTNIRKE